MAESWAVALGIIVGAPAGIMLGVLAAAILRHVV